MEKLIKNTYEKKGDINVISYSYLHLRMACWSNEVKANMDPTVVIVM